MNAGALLGLILLLCGPAHAVIDPPDDPRLVKLAVGVLRNARASQSDKLEALSAFTKTTNLTDEAFWTLVKVAGNASGEADAVRVAALAHLGSAIAYILPEDVERAEHTLALMKSDKFQAAFAVMETDPLPELRAKRLYFIGGVTLNRPAVLVRRLGAVFVPTLLSSLAVEKDPSALTEGLWSLEQYLAPDAASTVDASPVLRKIAEQGSDPSVRAYAASLLGVLPPPAK